MLSLLAAVSLIVAGDNPAQAGALQSALEAKLSAAGRPMRPAIETGKALAAIDPVLRQPAVDAVVQQTADKLLEDARRAYYDGRFDDAAAKLAALSAFLDGASSLPSSARVDLLLWRASLFLEGGDARAAEPPVREALVLSPDVAVSDATFPPSLVALVRRFQAQPSTRVTLRFTQLPPGAVVSVDDRPVTARAPDGTPQIAVPQGKHRILAAAPGREFVSVVVDARTALTLTLALPLLVPAAARPSFEGIALGTKVTAAPDELRALARRLDADALVLVHRSSRGTAALVLRGKRVTQLEPSKGLSDANLIRWIVEQLPGDASGLDVEAGTHVALRSRSVAGGWDAAFGGAGASVGLGKRVGEAVMLEADGYATTWVLSSLSVKGPDGSRDSGGGGASFGARLGAMFGRGRWSFGLGAAWNELRSEDVGDRGLFPSERRIAADFRLGLRLPVRSVDARLEAGFIPYAYVAETPTGATGDSPVGDPSGTLALLLDRRMRNWRLGATVATEMRRTHFEGPAATALQPAPRDARTTEIHTAVGVRVGRSF